ncbi:MAG: undecaprenyl-diphosphate phosphatase [Clostridia bacterium]|nr:undecaprenyl-diphosphate phosphatase [Clostridia bacterium]
MTYIQAVILGLVQGLAEFLPISSSGHLSLLQNIFGIDEGILFFTVMFHLGTLISLFIVYWNDIWELIVELVLTIKDLVTRKGLRLEERPIRKLGVMIIVTTAITGIIGIFFEDMFEAMYSSCIKIGIGLLITGFLLYFSERIGRANRNIDRMNFRNAIFIGIMQGVAIWPGISRSGLTLVSGLTCNFDRAFAVKYAFLISIPTILGSFLLEFKEAIADGITLSVLGPSAVGVVVAAISGLVAIKAMIKVVANKKLKYFSYYVWVVGILAIAYGIIF